MKRLILIFLMISASMLTADKKNNNMKIVDSSEETAVSINSEDEYNRLKPKDYEPKTLIKSAPLFHDPSHPWVRSAVSRDEKIGLKMAQLAESWLKEGKKSVVINKRRTAIFNDCCHFVRAIYWHVAGVDVMWEAVTTGAAKRMGADMNSGCSLIYSYMKSEERTGKTPRVGDIIFFDNTWDRNRNRRWDDPLTHVGMVTGVASDGTVTFVHSNTGRPKMIRKAYLNLNNPADRSKNTYLKVKYRWDTNPKLLAGQITRGFGGFSFAGSGFKNFSQDNKKDKKEDPQKKTEPSGKSEDNRIYGKWKLFWKNRMGIYSYIFSETFLDLKPDGSGTYKNEGASSACTWKKSDDEISVFVNGKLAGSFKIKSISDRELLVSSTDKYKRPVEMMFNKQ